jgi:ribosomal protein L40E
MMNLRRLLACGLATASLAGGVGSTVLVGHAASRTPPPVKQKVQKQHCVKPVAGQPPTANTCKPKPKPKPKTHTLKPKPKPVHTLPAPGH